MMNFACYPAMAIQPGNIIVETKLLHQFQELIQEMDTANMAIVNLLLLRLQRGALGRAAYLHAVGEHYSLAVGLLRNVMKSVATIHKEDMEQCPATKASTA